MDFPFLSEEAPLHRMLSILKKNWTDTHNPRPRLTLSPDHEAQPRHRKFLEILNSILIPHSMTKHHTIERHQDISHSLIKRSAIDKYSELFYLYTINHHHNWED